MIPLDVRTRLERLLRDLPDWETEAGRRYLLSPILRGHSVWEFLDLKGGVGVAASALIHACEKEDPESLSVLLAGLRDKYEASPDLVAEIDSLMPYMPHGSARRRGPWEGAPYPGLTYFGVHDAPIFFGREDVLRELVQTLKTEQGRRFTVVWGASGSGKSSLVRAGLWAGLADGGITEMPGSQHWLISGMTPTDLGNDPGGALWLSLLQAVGEPKWFRGDHDLKKDLGRMKDDSISSLAERLLRDAPAQACWLVILDQMEELFAAEMKETGAVFLDRLIEATEPPSRVRVVATVRGDLFHHCLDHPGLTEVVRRGGVYPLGRPDRRSLEEMVRGPLEEVELILESGKPWMLDPKLPAMIAVDAERHAGGLALMAFALRDLYDRCECSGSRHMDVATYRSKEFGGLRGAIGRKAAETLQSLGADAEMALDKVFARLVRADRPEDPPTRLRERLSVWDGDEAARRVIAKFQKAGLLVSDRGAGGVGVVEVAHEALFEEWPDLKSWIEKRREALHLREAVKTEAQIWMRGDDKSRRQRRWRAEVIDDHREALKAAGLLDGLLEDHDVARLLTPEVEWILGELTWEETTELRRWEIGRRLAEKGDPRSGVGVIGGVPDILRRAIPGGTVEIEGHGPFPVAPFEMAAYPVTFAQFRAFLEAEDGYANPRWWEGLKREDRDPVWESTLANHPVTHVSWFDATAFCRWLSARLDRGVRLPDEWEWQQAAQSGKEYEYPWGPKWLDGRANTRESDIQHTTAVGMFPRGDSEQRVSDLAGNVWEWCRNEYEHPRESGSGGDKKSRVLRGGSWGLSQDFVRAGYRRYCNPDFRLDVVGFRVVVSSPIGNAGR